MTEESALPHAELYQFAEKVDRKNAMHDRHMCRKSSCAAPLQAVSLLKYHAYFYSHQSNNYSDSNPAFKRF